MSALTEKLFVEIACQNAKGVRLLLAQGADVNATDGTGIYALGIAASQGKIAICKILLEGGARIDETDVLGWTALHWTARFNQKSACVLLLDFGANISIRTLDTGQTALDVALGQANTCCVNVLRSAMSANSARAALQEISAGTTPAKGCP